MNANFVPPEFGNCFFNVGEFKNQLPDTSFVSFETSRLKNAELVWVNEELLKKYGFNGAIEDIERYILSNYSYVAKNYTSKNGTIEHCRKIFFADRYGSRHEVCNGGSARCGFDGNFQVKGIGITPLLAQNMSKSHSNGKLFLEEAISEAVWGEICHKHLPYGAIRTLAIIKTNVHEEFSYLDEKPLKPCALAIREFAIRPAHFERATFFWPQSKYISIRDDDAIRVSESIDYLPRILEISNTEIMTEKEFFDCLEIITFRIARQVAYSRVKGIPHGSLTSSNISVDGRFLDFGTITAVPDFGNYILADGVGAVWDDHILIADWLKNMMENINRYSRFDKVFSTLDIKRIIGFFLKSLEHQENIAILDELNIEVKSCHNLALAKELKKTLLQSKRVQLGEFCSEDFKNKIIMFSKEKGLPVDDFDFAVRNFKHSSYSILNNKCLNDGELSKESIKNMIEQYC